MYMINFYNILKMMQWIVISLNCLAALYLCNESSPNWCRLNNPIWFRAKIKWKIKFQHKKRINFLELSMLWSHVRQQQQISRGHPKSLGNNTLHNHGCPDLKKFFRGWVHRERKLEIRTWRMRTSRLGSWGDLFGGRGLGAASAGSRAGSRDDGSGG